MAQDPFGGDSPTDTAGDAFSTPAQPRAGADGKPGDASSSYLNTDPLIRRVRDNPPKTPADMAQALTWMVQLRSWENVGTLLDRLAAANWPVTARAEVARGIEPSVWSILLKSSNRLNEAQNKTLKALYGSPAAQAREPAVIDANIDQLASSNSNIRRLAQLRLHDGQMVALKRLLDRLLEGDAKVPASELAAAIVQFEVDGSEALRAACCQQDETKRGRALVAAAELRDNKLALEVIAGLYSSSVTDATKSAIADKLKARSIALPAKDELATRLNKEYESTLLEYQASRTKLSPLTTLVWQPTADGKLVGRQLTRELANLERLAQLATLRSEIEGSAGTTLLTSTAIQLHRAYHQNPKLIDSQAETLLLRAIPEDRTNEIGFWVEAFQQCSKLQMHGGAVRALQSMTSRIQSGKVLAPLDFLSQILTDKRPVVRFLALQAIAAADPHSDYAGSAQAISTAVEMTQLSQGPEALVVGANSELCMSADEIIQQHTSAKSVIAHSAREALVALSKPNPVEWIVVVDRVHDISFHELIQRLRNASSQPIAVLVDNLSQSESNLISRSAGIHASTLSRDPEHMRIILEKSMQMLDFKPMSIDDRTDLAASAGQFLTKIASDRALYGFYPVEQWNQQLISTRRTMAPSAQAKILSALGDKESQVQLTLMAANVGAAQQDRIEAAKSFEKAVRQFGLQLNDQQIKKSYEQYNQLGPNDPATAKVLGYILDIIEAQAGSRSWPDPL
ncbi:MAG: hypothetical protein U0930_13245 [Pirellulales bacterium]